MLHVPVFKINFHRHYEVEEDWTQTSEFQFRALNACSSDHIPAHQMAQDNKYTVESYIRSKAKCDSQLGLYPLRGVYLINLLDLVKEVLARIASRLIAA